MLSEGQIQKVRGQIARRDAGRLIRFFSALGDSCRFRIFELLIDHEDVCVSDVAKVLGISLPAASQHLKIMELAGLVRKERMGQMTCYMLNYENAIVKIFARVISQECKGRAVSHT
ncbi:ArsR family transcriptional regulator [Candidatus Parcubacteria bacterium]|nr:MAG: ArsR family transcriptional regulator [Candidatus Parcubacteria bacterium]